MTQVTVGVPAYNAERYIARCLDSLLAQDMDSMEVIVVDDGSRDATARVALDLIKAHPRGALARVERSPRNEGAGPARNRAISLARGEYLTLVDADDTLAPGALRRMWETARLTRADAVYPSLDVVWDGDAPDKGATERVRAFCGPPYPDLTLESNAALGDYAYGAGPANQRMLWSVAGALLRRSLLDGGPRFSASRTAEDRLFADELLQRVGRAALTSERAYRYHIHPGSLCAHTREGADARRAAEYGEALARIKERLAGRRGAPYFETMCLRTLALSLYCARGVVRHEDELRGKLPPGAPRGWLKCPLTLGQALAFRRARGKALAHWALGQAPWPLARLILKAMDKLT